MLATSSCPATRLQRFPVDNAPAGYCTLHGEGAEPGPARVPGAGHEEPAPTGVPAVPSRPEGGSPASGRRPGRIPGDDGADTVHPGGGVPAVPGGE